MESHHVAKCSWLVALPFVAVLALFCFVILPWVVHQPASSEFFWLGGFSALIWALVLWWALHHLFFQYAGLFAHPVRHPAQSRQEHLEKIAILYPTKDDFLSDSCLSCLNQTYPVEFFKVFIADDSRTPEARQRIEEFVAERRAFISTEQTGPMLALPTVIRRAAEGGYKAGNLNHALRSADLAEFPWFIVVDADQILPPTFLRDMANAIAGQPEHIAFVQGRHSADHVAGRDPTRFQWNLDLEIASFYERDLPPRETFGFMPLLGHGAAIRRSAWQAVGGFPEIVSEDFAMALELRNTGRIGVCARTVRSFESFPKDFGAFVTRFLKFSAGSAELFRTHLHRFLAGPATLAEKVDLCMLLGSYVVMPLMLLNSYVSIYLCHLYWVSGIGYLHPVLPYIYLAMFGASFPIFASIELRPVRILRHYVYASAIYLAVLPASAVAFFAHLFRPAVFTHTPKGAAPSSRHAPAARATLVAGIVTCVLAECAWSPFTWVMRAFGLSFIGFPFFLAIGSATLRSAIGGVIAIAAAVCYVGALHAMWVWTKL